jgi:hypothetical protein
MAGWYTKEEALRIEKDTHRDAIAIPYVLVQRLKSTTVIDMGHGNNRKLLAPYFEQDWAEGIHLMTHTEMMDQLPPADRVDLLLDVAQVGSGWVHIVRQPDGKVEAHRIDPTRVRLQGDGETINRIGFNPGVLTIPMPAGGYVEIQLGPFMLTAQRDRPSDEWPLGCRIDASSIDIKLHLDDDKTD